jgi:PilZ domain
VQDRASLAQELSAAYLAGREALIESASCPPARGTAIPMYEQQRRSDRIQATFPIRVRGMSIDNKFFDEETETRWLSKFGLMTRLRNLVDLETEVHVTNLQNAVAGTFRTVWVNTRPQEGFYDIGLEISEVEGDMWGIHFPAGEIAPDETVAPVWLECKRCRTHVLIPVPEAEFEYLREGFLIARPCDRCKATTPWEFAVEAEIILEPGRAKTKKMTEKELRHKGRAPIKMKIKVIRRAFGMATEEICETDNVSRQGVYFHSSRSYEVGERLDVVMPYKEGDVAIPVPASVVRVERKRTSSLHAVAIRLEEGRN